MDNIAVKLFLFFFGVIGLTHIIVDSVIFEPVRNWFSSKSHWFFKFISKIISCYQCCAVYTGLFCGLICFGLDWQAILMSGFAGSFLANTAAILLNYFEAQTVIRLPDEKDG